VALNQRGVIGESDGRQALGGQTSAEGGGLGPALDGHVEFRIGHKALVLIELAIDPSHAAPSL